MNVIDLPTGPEDGPPLEQGPDMLGDKFPDGTTAADRACWVCGGRTVYRNCKIICSNCGFTRDCSDP